MIKWLKEHWLLAITLLMLVVMWWPVILAYITLDQFIESDNLWLLFDYMEITAKHTSYLLAFVLLVNFIRNRIVKWRAKHAG